MTRPSEPGRDADGSGSRAGVAPALGEARRAARGALERSAPRRAITVRRATPADLPVVVELRLALLRENDRHPIYGRLRVDARERAFDVFDAQLRAPNEVMLLAESGDEILGILRCVETFNTPLLHPERYCYVSSVYVRPRSRRHGVLTSLLADAEAWCAERGLTEMRLHNVPGGNASAAWSAVGFAVVEEVRRKGLAG